MASTDSVIFENNVMGTSVATLKATLLTLIETMGSSADAVDPDPPSGSGLAAAEIAALETFITDYALPAIRTIKSGRVWVPPDDLYDAEATLWPEVAG